MLRNQQAGKADPVVERIIHDMIREDSRFVAAEMRSVHRETLVVPVTACFKDGTTYQTFSRNISPQGVCLIGKEPMECEQVADLDIYRINADPIRIVAEIRWCKPFGQEYFFSGWRFIQVRRV